jgi:hypothetical protein
MAAHPALFRALDRLVLERTAIGAAGLASLRKLGPQIVHSEGSGARYRYVVGQE